MIKVSVVVPVWNPGRYLNRCVDSLLNQTLPPTDFETIFIDDGSTDGTSQHLDTLANTHPHFHVIHTPNSGWPGKPRNIGITHAQGQYIQFLDNDDSLGPEALQRLYHLGHTNDADIVIGKVTSDFRGVPHNIFRTTQPHCTIHDTPLIESLTPHKMFSKAFLDRNPDLRYPEGKRRLEDQLFMVRAYLAAKNVAILGDYPCYFYNKRDDGTNAGSVRIEPRGYYRYLREVLDVVIAGTEPGPQRWRLLERFYRNECLSRLGGAVLTYDDTFRRELFNEVCAVIAGYFPTEVERALPAAIRVRALAARAGRLDDLRAIAARYNGISASAHLEQLHWRQGSLVIRAEAKLVHADGTPVRFLRRDDRLYLDTSVCGPDVPLDLRDVTDEVPRLLADVTIKDRSTFVEFFLPGVVECVQEPLGRGPNGDLVGLTIRIRAELNPLTCLGGEAMPRGVWDLFVRLSLFGWTRNARLGSDRTATASAGARPALVGAGNLLVIPYWTVPHGNLSIGVNQAVKTLSSAVRDAPVTGKVRQGRHQHDLTINTALIVSPGVTDIPGRLHLVEARSGHALHVPAVLRAGLPDTALAVVRARVPRGKQPNGTAITQGSWRMTFAAAASAGDFSVPLAAVLNIRHYRRPVIAAPGSHGGSAVIRWAKRHLPPTALARARRIARRLRRT